MEYTVGNRPLDTVREGSMWWYVQLPWAHYSRRETLIAEGLDQELALTAMHCAGFEMREYGGVQFYRHTYPWAPQL